MLGVIRSKITFLNRKKLPKEDKSLKPETKVISMRILKKDRNVEILKNKISFEIENDKHSTKNELALFYNILLKEQKKDFEKGGIKLIESFNIVPSKTKKTKAKVDINITQESFKKIKSENDIRLLLNKILVIKTKTKHGNN